MAYMHTSPSLLALALAIAVLATALCRGHELAAVTAHAFAK